MSVEHLEPPAAFVSNLRDGDIKSDREPDYWIDGEYHHLILEGEILRPYLTAYILLSGGAVPRETKEWIPGFGLISWVNEPGGYRIASFVYGKTEDRSQAINESIEAIEKQRAARAEIVRRSKENQES